MAKIARESPPATRTIYTVEVCRDGFVIDRFIQKFSHNGFSVFPHIARVQSAGLDNGILSSSLPRVADYYEMFRAYMQCPLVVPNMDGARDDSSKKSLLHVRAIHGVIPSVRSGL